MRLGSERPSTTEGDDPRAIVRARPGWVSRLVPTPELCVVVGLACFVGLGLAGAGGVASGRGKAGHRGTIEALAFSSDGRTAASAGRDGALKVWDVAAHREVGEAIETAVGFACVAASPHGGAFVAGGFGGEILLVAAGKGRPLTTTPGPAARSVAFHPDGTAVAAGSDDGIVRVWDLGAGRLECVLAGHIQAEPGPEFAPGQTPPRAVRGLAFSPDGRALASVGVDGRVILREIPSGRILGQFSAACGPLWSVAFSPDGRTIAFGGSRGLGLLDVESGRLRRSPDVTGRVMTVQFLPGGRALAALVGDGVELWDVIGDPARARRLPDLGHGLRALAVSPDGLTFATGAGDGTLAFREIAE